jgi:hypothetical protein
MIVLAHENNIQALAAVKRLTGVQVRLQPFTEITAVEVEDDSIIVEMVMYRYQERRKDIMVTGRGVRVVRLVPQSPDVPWKTYTVTAWDDDQVMSEVGMAVTQGDMIKAQVWLDAGKRLSSLPPFETFAINTYGQGQSVDQWLDSTRHARMAGRVGASRYPLDTYARTVLDPSTKRMTAHWKRG